MRLLTLTLAFAFSLEPLPAQETGPREPTVYLVTADVGDAIFERFGHNAIWIHDPARGTDIAYNWGMFDFDQPGFLRRFLMGRMLYSMGPQAMDDMLGDYRYRNRTVWAQELNLTPTQKRALIEFVEWNARPENRDYRYDYYRDNCSTRVRDVLDRILGGSLRGTLGQTQSNSTYRSETRRLMFNDIATLSGMNLAMGPRIDEPLSAWDDSFIPMNLRESVRQLTVEGPNGQRLPLVKSESTLFQATRADPPASPPNLLAWYILAGTLLAGLFLLFGSLRARWGRVVFGLLAGAWSLVIGILGTLIAGLWAFTDHAVTYANENVLQANPLSLVLFVALIGMAFGSARARRIAAWTGLATAGLSVLGLLIQALPGLDQVNADTIALLLPTHVVLAWMLWNRKHQTSPKPAHAAQERTRQRLAA